MSSSSDEEQDELGVEVPRQRLQQQQMSRSSRADDRSLYSQARAGPSHHQMGSNAPSSQADEEDSFQEYMALREEDVIDVDDAITVLLASLNLERNRKRKPTERDDDILRRLHERIYLVIAKETDDLKRRRLKKALPASNCVREQVYYLRRMPSSPSASYFHRLSSALDIVVKESFDEEYRRVATVLGLVEALAEVLILELNMFGIPSVYQNEHRTIRKLIANALTNLTFGQLHSKRQLCSYSDFIRTIVRILLEAPNLTQVYAGLVRNLSWMADDEMSTALRATVGSLATAAVRAHSSNDDGCIRATLSALWNLASHSVENKKIICDTPNCLVVLCTLLTPDSRMTAVIDSATGILKYVSQYLSNTSSHLEIRNMLIARLVQLLGSASFTIVTNTLGAIANLIVKDPHLQSLVRHDPNTISQLNVLRNSAREDIRSAVKNVLNAINQPTGHTRFGEMSVSVGAAGPMGVPMDPMMMSASSGHHYQQQLVASTIGNATPRLLPLRAARASPGRYTGFGVAPAVLQSPLVADQRSCSLPRHFARGGAATYNVQPHGSMHTSYSPMHASAYAGDQQQRFSRLATPPQYGRGQRETSFDKTLEDDSTQTNDVTEDGGGNQNCVPHGSRYLNTSGADESAQFDDAVMSALATRNNSEHSLGSVDPGSISQGTGGWNSTLDTAANSSRMSPVSVSDIPSSPTMCAAFQQALNFHHHNDAAQQSAFGFAHPMGQPAFGMPQTLLQVTMPTDFVGKSDSTGHSGGSGATVTRDSGAAFSNKSSTPTFRRIANSIASDSTTAPLEDVDTPTYAGNSNVQRNVNVDDQVEKETLRKTSRATTESDDFDSPDDVLPGPALDDDDYAIVGTNHDLLNQSIQAEMPRMKAERQFKVQPQLGGFFAQPAEAATTVLNQRNYWEIDVPTSSSAQKSAPPDNDADRLLMECIMSEMPQGASPGGYFGGQPNYGAPKTTPPKNEVADRREDSEPSDRRPRPAHPTALRAQPGSHLPSSSKATSADDDGAQIFGIQKQASLESQLSSEDSFGGGFEAARHTGPWRADVEDVDTSIPVDCFDDDDDDDDENDIEPRAGMALTRSVVAPTVTIDCSVISRGSQNSSRATSARTGRATTPNAAKVQAHSSDSNNASRARRIFATSTPKNSTSVIPTCITPSPPKKASRLPQPSPSRGLDKKRSPSCSSRRPNLPPKPVKATNGSCLTFSSSEPSTEATDAELRNDGGESTTSPRFLETSSSNNATTNTTVSAKSAVIPPYNYQKPFMNGDGDVSERKPSSVQSNSKQMLVTTV